MGVSGRLKKPRIIQLGSRWRTFHDRGRTPGARYTEQKLDRSHSQTRRWEEKIPAPTSIPQPVTKMTPLFLLLISRGNLMLMQVLRRFLKYTWSGSLTDWSIWRLMKSSEFVGCKNPLSWLQQLAAGSCLEPEEYSLHLHRLTLSSMIQCNAVSHLRLRTQAENRRIRALLTVSPSHLGRHSCILP